MSVECVRRDVLGLGYVDGFELFYKLSTETFELGLSHLDDDSDYVSLISAVSVSNELSHVLQFYVEHETYQRTATNENIEGFDSDDNGKSDKEDGSDENDDTFVFAEGSEHESESLDDLFVENVNQVDQAEIEAWLGQEHGIHSGEKSTRDVDSDSVESEHLESPNESSDTDSERVGSKYNPVTDKGKTVVIEIGKSYPDQIVFRKQLSLYALAKGFDYKITKNDKRRVTAVCKQDDFCKWRIYASWNTDETSFVVKRFQPKHECGAQFYNSKVTGRWIAEIFFDNIKESPNIENGTLQALVQRKYNVYATLQQCYRAKWLVINKVYGDELKQYEKLGAYVEAVKLFNPGSRALVKTNGAGHFLRIYICLDACRKGFLNGCRPFIGLDTCHLKVYQQGQFFAAVSCDANDNLLPIAYAVCEIENTETWRWFIGELVNDIGIEKAKTCTFISDMQKGLDRALGETIENVDHRFCVRHLYNNFKKSFKGDIFKNYLWGAATATTTTKFEQKMSELNALYPEACDYLHKIPVKQWARHAFNEKIRCAMVLNNLCESFNAFIRDARDKPIIVMLEMVRRRLMERFNTKLIGMLKSNKVVCPRILKLLERIRKYEKEYITRVCGDGKFEVEHIHETNVVNLNSMTCTCRKWQLMGIPCVHACASIVVNEQQPVDFVYNCYTKATFLDIYKGRIHGIPSWQNWLASTIGTICPPMRKKQPSRPKKRRNREADETDLTKHKRKNTSLRCSRCQEWGHNVRTCRGQLKPKKKDRREGDNIKVIDLAGGKRQSIRISETDKGKEPVVHETTFSQPQPSQDSIEGSQGSCYTPNLEGPVITPTPGAFWQGTAQPNPVVHMPYLYSTNQVRRATARLMSKK